MKIIVGLGNPGAEYENTYHNLGWIAIDVLADKLGISVRTLSAELKKLRENGKLERIGGNRDGFWRVIRS